MYKVSVIVPIYNCEDYIVRCVDSLLSQTLQDIEIVLVDDGSSDGSLDICRKMELENCNIVVVHQSNQGAAAARKTGIMKARGEYIGFVDSDDWVHPRMFERLVEAAEMCSVDIVQCSYKEIHAHCEGEADSLTVCAPRVYTSRDALLQLFVQSGDKEINYLLWNKIFRTEIFKQIEIPSQQYSINDVPLLPRLVFASNDVAIIDDKLYYYYMRDEENNLSTMHHLKKDRERFIMSHIEAFDDVSSYFKDRDTNLYNASLKLTLQWCLSALKSKETSTSEKKYAIRVLKQHDIINATNVSLTKKSIALLMKLFPI